MTNASPPHFRSFASTKSPVIWVLHFASRGAMVSDGALVGFGVAVDTRLAVGLATAAGEDVVVPSGAAAWQAAARAASTARPALGRISPAIQPRRRAVPAPLRHSSDAGRTHPHRGSARRHAAHPG